MSKQQDALPYLVSRCCEVDSSCGNQLQGSVARGEERPESDIDLAVVFDDSISAPKFNELLIENNRGVQIRVLLEPYDVNVDINWVYEGDLLAISQSPSALAWYMFAFGRAIHDSKRRAQRCQDALQKWFESHPQILSA